MLQIVRWFNTGIKPAMGHLRRFHQDWNQLALGKEPRCIYTAKDFQSEKQCDRVTSAYKETMSNTCIIHFLACAPTHDTKMYRNWVDHWKDEYKRLSQLLRESKKMRKSTLNSRNPESFCGYVRNLKQLANKMLIARENAKMARWYYLHKHRLTNS